MCGNVNGFPCFIGLSGSERSHSSLESACSQAEYLAADYFAHSASSFLAVATSQPAEDAMSARIRRLRFTGCQPIVFVDCGYRSYGISSQGVVTATHCNELALFTLEPFHSFCSCPDLVVIKKIFYCPDRLVLHLAHSIRERLLVQIWRIQTSLRQSLSDMMDRWRKSATGLKGQNVLSLNREDALLTALWRQSCRNVDHVTKPSRSAREHCTGHLPSRRCTRRFVRMSNATRYRAQRRHQRVSIRK